MLWHRAAKWVRSARRPPSPHGPWVATSFATTGSRADSSAAAAASFRLNALNDGVGERDMSRDAIVRRVNADEIRAAVGEILAGDADDEEALTQVVNLLAAQR